MEYDIEYQENLLRLHGKTAERICGLRWAWVEPVGAKTVLDYGSGPGFFRAYRPAGVEVDTFDIAPAMQTGIRRYQYDLITIWDVIEHIEDHEFLRPVFDMSDHVACTVPVFQNGQPLEEWAHYKPGEHVVNFSFHDVLILMLRFGFELVKAGMPECPPRTDIYSFLFERGKRG